jgi:hypothetical protein
MAAVHPDQLSQQEKDELICTYAAFILHDEEADMTVSAVTPLSWSN